MPYLVRAPDNSVPSTNGVHIFNFNTPASDNTLLFGCRYGNYSWSTSCFVTNLGLLVESGALNQSMIFDDLWHHLLFFIPSNDSASISLILDGQKEFNFSRSASGGSDYLASQTGCLVLAQDADSTPCLALSQAQAGPGLYGEFVVYNSDMRAHAVELASGCTTRAIGAPYFYLSPSQTVNVNSSMFVPPLGLPTSLVSLGNPALVAASLPVSCDAPAFNFASKTSGGVVPNFVFPPGNITIVFDRAGFLEDAWEMTPVSFGAINLFMLYCGAIVGSPNVWEAYIRADLSGPGLVYRFPFNGLWDSGLMHRWVIFVPANGTHNVTVSVDGVTAQVGPTGRDNHLHGS